MSCEMKGVLLPIIIAAIGCFAKSSVAASSSPVAFAGAEGFGALATGGNGGELYHVTNLDDSGPGTFRDAVSRPSRTIIFNVAGTIHLQSNISASSDLTILGQTAPGDGITLYGRSISFSGCTNVIVRYLRIREGITGDKGKCSINIVDGGNMIFDHVSVEWGRWDCLGLTHGSRDITFQYCLLGQGIDPQRFGALVDTVTNVTFSHNLWIDNESRNPKAKGTIQYINNIVYNWGVNGLVGGHSEADHELDVVGNYFIKGPSSNNHFVGLFTSTDHVCQKDNYVDLEPKGQPGGHLVTDAEFRSAGGSAVFVSRPFLQPAVPVTVDTPVSALEKAIADAGCSLHRDAVDQALISELKSFGKTGHIITDESGHGIQSAAR
jgi:pectate lyase